MFRGRRVPDELLPVLMVWTWVGSRADRVRARARQVHSKRELGALSVELVILAVGLFLVAGALVVVITKFVKTKSTQIH
ncbi:hypothetical protein [Streptacidiphilus pinicola]|uniref:hypothetical protein n=1 Tax=Streptacidiphilus pinicola TaxID=2219663 RepID=UPI00140212AC|nr:hypothetical protein [Streptacidiphilus pinicola]